MWLEKFIFSWYSAVFHLAVSNLRLRFGFGFIFFSFCSPKSYPVGQLLQSGILQSAV